MDLFNDSLIDLSSNISALLCELDLENYSIFCVNHPPRTFKAYIAQDLTGEKSVGAQGYFDHLRITSPLEMSLVPFDIVPLGTIGKTHAWYPIIANDDFQTYVLGNTLVITVLIRNKRIRTVTNFFLLSLAISDLMLCFFCMPFTLIPNLLQDFIFGSSLCKITSYFMGSQLGKT
ncbi:hypothetical protein Chor_000812 [Crotalus horridus]